jgi:hypothetical protein
LRNDLIGLIYYKLSSIIVRKRKRNIAYQSNVKKEKTNANSNFYPLKGYFEGIFSLESVSGKSISFKDE